MTMLINPYSFGGGGARKSFQEILVTDLALSTGLQLILDAGDINSWAGSGNWIDVASTNDFGPLTGASGGDPTFHGVAGGLSEAEYFTCDGTAFPAFDETAAQTFMEPFHQNNAAATFMAAVYLPDPSSIVSDMVIGLIYDAESATQRGVSWSISYVPGFGWFTTFSCFKGSAPAAYVSSTNPLTNVQVGWNLITYSIDEAANVRTAFANGVGVTGACTYSSPSATATGSLPNSIFKNAGTNVLAGLGIGGLFAWSNYKAEAALDPIYAAIKADRLLSLP